MRIGLALYGSSCRPRCELNLFFGGNKKSVGEKKFRTKQSCAKTAYRWTGHKPGSSLLDIARTPLGVFASLEPVLSSPARGSPSLAMAQRRIEVVFVLWDDLKLTSGLRTPTAFNGQNYFFKIGRSKVLEVYYLKR